MGLHFLLISFLLKREDCIYNQHQQKLKEKRKPSKEAYPLIVEEASNVYAKSYCDWNKGDFVIAVLFKQGPVVVDTKKVIVSLFLFPSIHTHTHTHTLTHSLTHSLTRSDSLHVLVSLSLFVSFSLSRSLSHTDIHHCDIRTAHVGAPDPS